ncbi:MAG: arylesterase [Pontixanthobacter sp.]
MQHRLSSIVPLGLILGTALLVGGCRNEAPSAEPVAPSNAAADTSNAVPVMGPERRILAFGNSLFAGYNVDAADSYPAKLEAAMRARGIDARVTNAGVSGDTTAAGQQRLAFILDAQATKPDLFILELGGNDLLRGIEPAETRANLDAMLAELRKRDIPVLLMGMRAPPNFAQFRGGFDAIYPDLAERYDAELVPFFLESIYREPSLIQSDRIHPTEEGIETLVAATLDEVVNALPPEE